ncbi:ABC transporter ATP-binding protein [Sulfitobacter sp. S190]|uniref:ABC transporter ATP-binding protein n=1 Tax=Sulfitobacter sp. S190 TaxID=2867022 RepID=UPI0021A9368D|nr:ATP-binding cassette domain-containing protein [Sulfitobacter sp. S190]
MLKINALSVVRGSRMTLDDITLSLPAGKTLAIVGESGAGKSTLIGAILGLVKPASGDITWNDTAVRYIRPALVTQEPRAAFNPVLRLRQSVMEPVVAQGIMLAEGRLEQLCIGLELPPDLLDRRPHEVSIGQAQRAGILRALIASPPLVLFDEPLSALDAVTQKHTAQVIADVQAAEGFAALIVTHDLGYAVAHADQIAVLKDGHIEEIAGAKTFALNPQSAYCRRLRDAAIALGALEAVA